MASDLPSDLTVGVAMQGVFVGSQDLAHNLEELKHHGVTHILNVAYRGFPRSRNRKAKSGSDWSQLIGQIAHIDHVTGFCSCKILEILCTELLIYKQT